MSLFGGPEAHAENNPTTWRAVKVGRAWHLVTQDGTTLVTAETRRECLSLRESGFYRRIYDDEARWYAGEAVAGWKPYAPIN